LSASPSINAAFSASSMAGAVHSPTPSSAAMLASRMGPASGPSAFAADSGSGTNSSSGTNRNRTMVTASDSTVTRSWTSGEIARRTASSSAAGSSGSSFAATR
jgi:hypothetical protein